ncbi:MAG: winged helix-turn-helix transcriptional regulator, partial [Candidatus Staskawiczbacteria bacterium]|nr:winged helix-turn-helix transcriptional regulator [Candidatus Staskawiczbacteria bacterium]
NLLAKAEEKIQFNKKKKIEKIMELARRKGSVNNAEVEKLLRVSHATAWRYLNRLVKKGRLKILGKSVDERYEPL